MSPRSLLAALAAAMLLSACVQDTGRDRPAVEPPAPTRSRVEANRDDALKAVAERRLAELDRGAFRAVTVEVWQGRALLVGAVIRPEQRRRAEQAVRTVEGIAELRNELVLAEDSALAAFVPDAEREAGVRAALGLEGKAGTSVRVVNNVAYLLGAAGSKAQADRWKAAALDVDGVKWVVSHLRY